MVFYRKYRPQNFEELVGQDHVKKTLLAAFNSGKLGHAYLFTGPRGSGKTSTARILAKIVNCEAGGSALGVEGGSEKAEIAARPADARNDEAGGVPCNKCSSCLTITDGSNLDLIEIDAASNRGIDDIRELREKVKLSPSSAKQKVYIIDEVHMLTTEAFNALLKTLEEPPAHVLFILATTEVHKLPVTILSRVQRFDFKLASMDEVKLALKNICNKEDLKISEEVLTLISEISEGSFRDAVKLLDQVASAGEISLEETQALLKANDFSETLGLIEKVISSDAKAALELIQKINEKGTNIKEFTNSILKALRQILLIKSGASEIVGAEVGSGRLESLKGISEKIDQSRLIYYLENFQKSLEQLKFTSIVTLPLEVAVVKSVSGVMGQVSSDARLSTVIPASEPESRQMYSGPLVKHGMINEIASGGDSDVHWTSSPRNDGGSGGGNGGAQPEPIPSVDDIQSTDDILVITDKWTYILETIRPYNFSLEALLKQSRVKNCDGVNVVIEVPYSFHQRILEAPKSRTLLESVLADVLGKSVKVTTVLGKREMKSSELANVEVAKDDEIVRLAAEIFNS